MANWITHMMITDGILEKVSGLDRRGFCIGNVAPDCNVENADWTTFMPPREVTHWMGGERKGAADCERFYDRMIAGHSFASDEERSFMLGYYVHLVSDACFQKFVRNEARVQCMIERIMSRPVLAARMEGHPKDFDGVKRAFSKGERLRDVDAIEFEYVRDHPQTGYMTVLREVHEFPDYIDYLPHGAIVRKLRVMAVLPVPVEDAGFVFFTREEYARFVDEVVELAMMKIACPAE